MIGVRAEASLLERIVRGLLHPESPVSYNLIVPPGFGEDRLAQLLGEKLRSQPEKPLVAVVSADQIRNADSYAYQLFEQWRGCGAQLGAPVPGNSLNRITQFLDLLPKGRPAIQILTRFHKVLDVFDASFLGDLRDRERAYVVRSICVSPYGYDELRQRWREVGHFFCNSDYGLPHRVEPVEPLEAEEAVEIAAGKGVPAHVAKVAAGLTGCFPEPFEGVVNAWVRLGRPALGSGVQVELRREAQRGMKRFVEWLDPDGQRAYRDAVLELHVDPNQQEAGLLLERHPWGRVLLKDGRLRTELLAGAVVVDYLQPKKGRREQLSDVDLWNKGAALYRGWRFALAKKLLDVRRKAGGIPNYLAVLDAHALVMGELYGGDAEAAMTACDWEAACKALRVAEGQVSGWRLGEEGLSRLGGRYEGLGRFCQTVHAARRANPRVVDVLLGMRGDAAKTDRRAAMTLLVAHLTYDSRISGDTLACQTALPLLEQVFRAWAFVALGLNYYAAPAGHEDIWKQVEPCFGGVVRRPTAGEEFTSFEAFAYFCIALHRRDHADKGRLRPEEGLEALERSLGVLNARRDLAHAVSLVDPKIRRNYFEITNRWLDCVLACDVGVGTRDELLGVVEPLPLLTPEGELR